MTDLQALQRSFQRALIEGDDALTAAVVDSAALSASDRVGIYRDAYRLRLREALAANYPRLQQLVGEDSFATIADAYIDAHPSNNPSVRWFGERLAEELNRSFPDHPWLGELARWEWAVAAAFDARDAKPIALSRLAEVSSDAWPTLRFAINPSVQVLLLHTNAALLFKALTDEAAPPQPARIACATWVIWRENVTTRFRSLDDAEAAALNVLMRGDTFEDMCTELCTRYAAEDAAVHAATFLREWVSGGLISDLSD